jgi:tetratricopeptide (TPR) repeat protein
MGLFILVAALAIVWARRPTIARDALILPGVCYVLLSTASTFWALNPLSSVVEVAPLISGLILLIALTSTLGVPGFLRACHALALGGGVVGIIGIAQYFDAAFTWIPSVGLPSATFGFRNVTASFLMSALPLATASIFAADSEWRRLSSLAGTLLMGILLVYTRTRGAWLGLAVACVVIAALAFKAPSLRSHLRIGLGSLTPLRRWGLVLLLVIAAFAATRSENTSDAAFQRFDEQKTSALTALQSTFNADSDRGRLARWGNTVDLIRDHPLLGVGLDNWEYAYPPYGTSGTHARAILRRRLPTTDQGTHITPQTEPARPHNDLLWITSEIGIIGLFIYTWLLFQAAKGAWDIAGSVDPVRSLVGIACAASLTAFSVHGLLSFPKEQPASMLLFWTALSGLAIARQKVDHSPIRVPKWMGPLTVVVCLLALCVGWRHLRFDGPFQRALAAAQTRNWGPAGKESAEALNRGPIDHRAAFIRAKALHEQGRLAEAEAGYARALDYHPNYANTHHNLAGLLAQQNDLGRALEHFEAAGRLRPSDPSIKINHGNALIRAGRFDNARMVFRSLISVARAAHQAHAALGAIELYVQNPSGAIEHLEHAVEIEPDFPEARNNLALAYEQSGRLREAIETYEAVIEAWRGDPTYLDQIRAHLQTLREQDN